MDTTSSGIKKGALISVAAMSVLLIGAMVFFKARILFADGAFIGFNTINYKSTYIGNNRFGEYLTQSVPYLGEKLHIPIKALLFLFAISYNLFYLLAVVMLVYVFKEYKLAILISLYYFLITSDSFICISDISIAIAMMAILYAIVLALGRKNVNVLIVAVPFLLIAFLTVSTHFVVIIPLAFLWLYLILDKENWPFSIKNTLLLSFLMIAIFAAKYITIARSETYDATHLQGVSNLSFRSLLHAVNTPVIKMFVYRCIINYWIMVVIFFLGIRSLIKSKKILLAVFTLVACSGYFLLMGITYAEYDKHVLLFHIEGEWASFGIIAATPFVFELLPKLTAKSLTYSLTAIFLVRLVYIGMSLPDFTWRVHFQDKVFAQMKKKNITKLALYGDSAIDKKYMLEWAMPYESILSSAMKGDYPQRTFFIVNKDYQVDLKSVADPKVYFNVWNTIPYTNLNARYFAIDTTKPYSVMSFSELFAN